MNLQLPMVPLPAEEANREDLIREHFTSRISQLTKDVRERQEKRLALNETKFYFLVASG